MSEQSNLKKLIQKVGSDLPQIQIRSLNNIYTKISHQIISVEALLQFPQFPGVLMSWINENKKKSDMLLKVIYLLGCYTHIDKGLLLLRQYECLQFCEQFKIYLLQYERGVDAYVQELDTIIRSLLPLGRADQTLNSNIQNNNANSTQNVPKDSKAPPAGQKPVKSLSSVSKQVKQILKFKCQVINLQECEDKIIFELLMKAKYANKDTIYLTLIEIRKFVSHYIVHTYRCKPDLVSYLCEIAQANVFAELCMEVVAIVLKGLIRSQTSCETAETRELVNLTYAKVSTLPTIDVEISLPLKVFELPESCVIIKQLLANNQQTKIIPLKYLLCLNYKYSPEYLITILNNLSEGQIFDNLDVCLPAVEIYCNNFPHKAQHFVSKLPQNTWKKIKSLNQFVNKSQKHECFKHIEEYICDKEFALTKNLHIMRQIVDNLKKAVKGIEIEAKKCVKFYLDVLIVLAISVSRQDPLMSYFGEAQELLISLGKHPNKSVAIALYQQLLQGLKNKKSVVNYPGIKVHRFEVVQIIFTSPEFTNKIMQYCLQLKQTLIPMLHIIQAFLEKDKFKVFSQYVAIIFALSSHPCEQVAALSDQITNKMNKNYIVPCIACRLFSTNIQSRVKLLGEISSIKNQVQLDMVERIKQGHFTNKKKQLKISAESIENYLNIVLNPGLEPLIRQSALDEFIDCIERAEGKQLPDLQQAQLYLLEEIKKMNKKQKLQIIDEKLIVLHLLLAQKIDSYRDGLSLQYSLSLLCKVSSASCCAAVLVAIYRKVFGSPFSRQANVKSWVMMHYPHVQVTKMSIEHPVRTQAPEQDEQPHPQQQQPISIIHKSSNKFMNLYHSIMYSLTNSTPLSQQTSQLIQEEVVSATTSTDIVRISKLAFMCNHFHPAIRVHKQTFKIILQYVRTNPAANDVAEDLVRIIKCTSECHEVVGNFGALPLLLLSVKDNPIANDEVDKLLKMIDDIPSKARVCYALATETAVKFSTFNEYNSLKLIQTIISTLRGSNSDYQSRTVGMALLNRVITSQFHMDDHIVTILTLLRNLLFQNKLNTAQFVICLNCYSEMIKHIIRRGVDVGHVKMTASVVQQLCALVQNCAQSDNTVLLAACFSFLNDVLRNQCVCDSKQRMFSQLIENQPNNIIILATGLVPKKIPAQSNCNGLVRMISEIYTFLYFCSLSNQSTLSTILNSTDTLSTAISLIIPVTSHAYLPLGTKLYLFQSLGRLLHKLSHKSSQFIFKLNKIVRSQGQNSQYKLHYTLMSPIPTLKQHYETKHKRYIDNSYIQMVCWVMHIWKQSTHILQEVDFIQTLVNCVIFIKQIRILAPLLVKSSAVQRMVVGCAYVCDRIKAWIKCAHEIVYEKTGTKNKKNSTNVNTHINTSMNASHLSMGANKGQMEQLKRNIEQGIIFLTSIFTPIQNQQMQTQELLAQHSSPHMKQTVAQSIRLIDQTYVILQLQHDEHIYAIWSKLLTNIFRNNAYAKILCILINEGNFETVNQLVAKIDRSSGSLVDNAEQLQLLAYMSCNESVRSLIVKNRIIQLLITHLIAMDENKVAKVNYSFVYSVVCFFYYLSAYKDTNSKIQNDKKLLDILSRVLSLQQSEVVEHKIIHLLINLAAFKHSKATFMACKDIHKVCLGLLSDADYEHKQSVLELIYNILYKNAAGIKLYKRKEVMELIQHLAEVEELREICQALMEVFNCDE